MKRIVIFLLLCPLLLAACELFDGAADPDFLDKLYEEVAWANAPWVPLRIETGILGTASPMGPQPNLVKLGYSFKLFFQPDRNYPFQGWQAWVDGDNPWSSYWLTDDTTDVEKRVVFVPLNEEGTEVEIFIYEMPPPGLELNIGPLGAARGELTVMPDRGGLGIIHPSSRLPGIIQGYPFTMSFQPSANYPFRGWQIKFADGAVYEWKVGEDVKSTESEDGIIIINWVPRNAFGTEISITIVNLPSDVDDTDVIIVGPIGMDSPELTVSTTAEGLGSITSTITETSPVRLGYSFAVSFQPMESYPFRGWQVRFDAETVSVWKTGDVENDIDEYVRWEPQNASGTEMRLTILNLPDDAEITDVIIIGPLGMDNPQIRINIYSGGLGTIISSIQGDFARLGYPFTVSFQPSAGFPFQGWQLMADNTVISSWTEAAITENPPGDEDIWKPRNASGTDMEIIIRNLPDNNEPVTIMPIGAESMPAAGQVFVPAGWGSANMTALENRRQSFPFTIEFTPSSEWAFIEWRAYTGFQSMSNMGTRITDDSQVKFDDHRSLRTQVTINLNVPVTLVPFCYERPKVEQTSPPLINSGAHYTRGQQITIWMDLGFTANRTLSFNDIQITGQHVSGEAVGSLAGHFNAPVYNAESRTIIIEPNVNNYPPGTLNITVSVGTGVFNINEVGMASPVVFSYRINNEIVTRAYKASNVWANHNPANDSRIESFFFQTAPTDRDRRLRKNSEGEYEVTLYFGASRSVGEITDQDPDSLIITEIYYTDLAGRSVTFPEGDEYDYEIEGGHRVRKDTPKAIIRNNEGSNSAGGIYRLMNPNTNPLGMGYYRAVYTFPPDSPAGIYRLAVQPLRTGTVAADSWQIATAEGSFVTVVLDDKAPGGTGMLNFSGHYRLDNTADGNVSVYSTDDKFFTMRSDFSFINDNLEGGGILLRNANPNLPWTMDEQRNLFWQWQIVRVSNNQTTIIKDYDFNQWLPFGTNPESLDLSTVLSVPPAPSPLVTHGDGIMQVRVRFMDSLGNESQDNILGRIAYVQPPESAPVANWSATYNASANVISINWTTPSIMHRVDVFINDTKLTGDLGIEGPGNKSFNYTGVNQIIPPAVSSEGISFTPNNINKYTIKLVAKRDGISGITSLPYPPQESDPIVIWNIPGMITTEENPIIELTNSAQFTTGNAQYQFASSVGKTYVLTQDITLTDHIPVGTEAAPFSGRIFGTGNTITVNSIASDQQYNGVFGYVNGAVIQYLDVEYPDTFSVDASAAAADAYAGGIIAYAIGDTRINNSVVRSSAGGIRLSNNTSGIRNNIYIGGVAGRMTGGNITNCVGAVNVDVDINRNVNNIFAGGLSGTTGPAINSSAIASGRTVSVSLAAPDLLDDLSFWRVNDVMSSPDDSITITGAAPAHIQPRFSETFTVNNFTDSTNAVDIPGTLRHALYNAQSKDAIIFSGVTPGTSAIELFLALPEIKGNLTIEGNGITIIPNWTLPSDTSQLLRITDAGADVKISRVHFKDGRATGNGGAIHNTGNLTLESCIFTNNRVSASNGNGSAVWSGTGNLTVSGCTFYNNRADDMGTIFIDGTNTARTVTLTGNLFYGNTAGYNFYILRPGDGTVNATYNVTNMSLGTTGGSSGFAAGTTNIQLSSNDILRVNTTSPFIADNLAPFVNLNSVLPAQLPADFPATDFYGEARTRAPGAVNNVTRRLFVVNNNSDSGIAATTAGTLRHAITNAQNDDVIRVTTTSNFTLTDSLPQISRRISIEGNGNTLTRATSWTDTSAASQFIRVGNGGDVKISRLAFNSGIATDYGAAIRNNTGTVLLESCVFYNNNTTNSDSYGGALYNTGTMTVKGCTFLVNNAGQGGAIYTSGPLNLTGNLFYGNVAGSNLTGANLSHVVRIGTGVNAGIISYGYNVMDVVSESVPNSFEFSTGDVNIGTAGSPVDPGNYRLRSATSVTATNISSLPPDYPKVDFYGNPITGIAAAGAVQGTTTNTVSSIVNSYHDIYNSAAFSGTLRHVILFGTGDISFPHVTANSTTIEITRPLPLVTNRNINGGGVILTRSSSMAEHENSQLLRINNSTLVTVSRVRFKDGRATNYGAAIRKMGSGRLTIDSCIFDGNQTSASNAQGGAIFNNTGTLLIRGSTFYANRTEGTGGAIFTVVNNDRNQSCTINGNFFCNNFAGIESNVIRGWTSSGGYNYVSGPLGNSATNSGFSAASTDRGNISITDMFQNGEPFNPNTSFMRVIPITLQVGNAPNWNWDNMPSVDFYGNSRIFGSGFSHLAPGAVR